MRGRADIFLLAVALLTSAFACASLTNMFVREEQNSSVEFLPEVIPTVPEPTPSPEAACSAELTGIIAEATAGRREINTSPVRSDDETHIATYKVLGDELSSPHYEPVPADLQDEQDDTASHEEIWNYFASMIPLGQRELIAEFSIITDGHDGTLAAVTQTGANPELWAVEVDIADAQDKSNLTYTLLHEFGHLLTLGPDQVQPSLAIFNNPDDNDIFLNEVSACPSYFPGEGCSRSDSYINSFYNDFWVGIYVDWQKINRIENEETYYEALDNFYLTFKDHFVTDYAANSPEEDIAESWAFFVLGPKPRGDTIAEEKTLFFYDFPELVQLREEILDNVCTVYP